MPVQQTESSSEKQSGDAILSRTNGQQVIVGIVFILLASIVFIVLGQDLFGPILLLTTNQEIFSKSKNHAWPFHLMAFNGRSHRCMPAIWHPLTTSHNKLVLPALWCSSCVGIFD